MADIDEHGRPAPPVDGDEAETLVGFLDHQRATLAWKVSGLDAAGLATTVAASPMTLGGMLKHLAYVEEWWFCEWLFGRDAAQPWASVDWDADADWDWHSAAAQTPEELMTLWQEAVAESRAVTTEALAEGGPSRLSVRKGRDGYARSLRWVLVHMVEEYARHNGHADLIREAIDGETGA